MNSFATDEPERDVRRSRAKRASPSTAKSYASLSTQPRSAADLRGFSGRKRLSAEAALAIAVNQSYAVRTCLLRDGGEVALLPPVSGGCAVDISSATGAVALVRERIDSASLVAALTEGAPRSPQRTRIPCYAASDKTACAAFLKKAAWSFLIPLSPTGNPGEAPATAFAAEVSTVSFFWESNGNPSP
jgi:molybdopterin converting factor small subunit